MYKLHLLGVFSACVMGLLLSVQAQAVFIIDDFNVNSSSAVGDFTVNDGPRTTLSTIDGANIVMNGVGWTRTLEAELFSTDPSSSGVVSTGVCSSCGAGQFITQLINSVGLGVYTYSGSTIDLSAYRYLIMDWAANQNGLVAVNISDEINRVVVGGWRDLPDTGGSTPADLVTLSAMEIDWGLLNPAAITEIEFFVSGVSGSENIDAIIDNIRMVVPVPAAVWLFGSGLLGMIGIARRKKVT